jgi:DNA-binding transcriptional LysR family regulator
MTLDQSQIFIAVAEREHVTRAADTLGLAPPSVSAAVASLEREFGTKLFHRVGRGIALTEGGKLLLDEARTLVNRADAVKLAMREFTGLSRGRLEIKASQTIASHFLPSRLVDFHQAYPRCRLGGFPRQFHSSGRSHNPRQHRTRLCRRSRRGITGFLPRSRNDRPG